jgi:hypothetical protein
MYKIIKPFLTIAMLLMLLNSARASVTLSIDGPELINNTNGNTFANAGLVFTALSDVTLDSFTFQNQGKADTIRLMNGDGDILYSYESPNGENNHQANVFWNLEENQSYVLYSEDAYNGKWSYFSSFPVQNEHLKINGSHLINGFTNIFWFNFSNLTITYTDPAPVIETPVPAAIWFFGSSLLFLGFNRNKA